MERSTALIGVIALKATSWNDGNKSQCMVKEGENSPGTLTERFHHGWLDTVASATVGRIPLRSSEQESCGMCVPTPARR